MVLPSLIKQPSESRLFSMDFSAMLSAGAAISGCTVSVTPTPTVPPLTVGAAVYDQQVAQVRISGGKVNTTYKVTFVVTTTDGDTLEGEGNLIVREI